MNEINIKNMVCDRCVATVSRSLSALGAEDLKVRLGYAEYSNSLNSDQVAKVLHEQGFELLRDVKDVKVEQIKLFLQSLLIDLPLSLSKTLSDLLSENFAASYASLSKLFSQHEEVTIERYFMLLKLEKVKELIQEKRMNFTEIAQVLDYASVNHLSGQFKTHIGLSLSDYKKLNADQRKPIDKIV